MVQARVALLHLGKFILHEYVVGGGSTLLLGGYTDTTRSEASPTRMDGWVFTLFLLSLGGLGALLVAHGGRVCCSARTAIYGRPSKQKPPYIPGPIERLFSRY